MLRKWFKNVSVASSKHLASYVCILPIKSFFHAQLHDNVCFKIRHLFVCGGCILSMDSETSVAPTLASTLLRGPTVDESMVSLAF